MNKYLVTRLREIIFPLAILAVLLTFIYALLFEVPYAGFYVNPTSGEILSIMVTGKPPAVLELGDVVQQIGTVSWNNFYGNGLQQFFDGVSKGDVIDVTVERGGQVLTIPWRFPGFNWQEFWGRFFNLWWLAPFFWFFGMISHLFLRPKDTRWRLMLAFNYLTAFWIILGSLSGYHFWASSVLLRVVTWLLLPIYIHLHWLFPKPFRRLPAWRWSAFYLASGLLAVSELFQILPRSLYAIGFFLAMLGSVVLLIVHFVKQPAERNDLKLVGITVLVAIFPSVILGISGVSGSVPQVGPMALLALPVMPGAYFYIVYRKQSEDMELRANKLVSLYLWLILLGTLLIPLLAPLALLPLAPTATIPLLALAALLVGLVSILAFPTFQAFVDQRFLGIRLPYQNLQEIYSAGLSASTSRQELIGVLEEELIPSLLVRQFGFLEIEERSPKVLLSVGLDESQLLSDFDPVLLLSEAEKYRPVPSPDALTSYPWARLILPLQVGEAVIGFWLFGRRDPDDVYAQVELPILRSLANQTAIGLSNLVQAENLRAMYQANVNRYEEERLALALDLHDSILNQLAVLTMNLDGPEPSPKFQDAYDELTQRLREIVSDLRPPMLNYGLEPAIRELADNLMERSRDTIRVTVELQTDGSRYASHTELHLFRILQEGCENAARHAQARNITISGRLLTDEIALEIRDDGVGFDAGDDLQLGTLIADRHFGLAGIIERAAIIGAQARIVSQPNTGTKIKISGRLA